MNDSEDLTQLASQATTAEHALKELLIRRRSASTEELTEIDEDIDQVRAHLQVISEQAAVITRHQIDQRLKQARASADPNGPRMDMDNLMRALTRALGWRRDESCYIENGIRKLPTLNVVAAWDKDDFIHFVIHVIVGQHEGFLGYCYEADPSRWAWQVANIEAQEVHELSGLWFYGENLVPKITGAAPGEIKWQDPVPDKALPDTMNQLQSIDLGTSISFNPAYISTP